jgi:phosphate transport system substrate-binding protein
MSGSCRWPSFVNAAALSLALAVAMATGCSSAPADRRDIRIAGSDTMLDLNRRLAEGFMRSHPGVAVRVEGGGTGVGVRALRDRTVDLAAASRPFAPDEVRALHDRFGTLGLRFLVARDALTVYLNPANSIRDLTMDQLRSVFSGEVSRWSVLGGADQSIVVVIRPPSSGTHRFFRDRVLAELEYSSRAVTVARTRDVVAAVGSDLGAVGYGAVIFGTDLPRLSIDGVQPTVANVRDGSYPLGRYLYFYATKPPEGINKEFLDWCLGADGQAIVADVGFVPLWIDG